ncbi:MAG: hypothetical protein ACREDO_06345 [Methyloceanibacter sp.]
MNARLAALLAALVGVIAVTVVTAPPAAFAQLYLDDLDDPDEDTENGEDVPEATEPDQMLRPDTKPYGEEADPPQSAQEKKENKLDRQLGQQKPGEPIDRPKLLAQLYEQLKAANDASTAEPIVEAIEEVWAMSGSDTVDLLMSRADQFAKDADLDLSLSILDAATEIAPKEPEIWHRRAMVHMLRSEYERALSDLRRTLNLDPKRYKAINDLALVLEQIGAKKEALAAYRKALEINPFLDDARQAVEQLSRDVEGQDI